MSHLTTSKDLPSATFSPVSASGPVPSASQDGLTIARSGQAPARASLSARQAKEMGLLTSGTFGPTSSISSASADLSMSLANRLQQVTQTYGSTLYKLTWKEWDTPSGLCRLRQRASARRTSESGPTGWPTPQVNYITNATTVQMSSDGRVTPNKIGWAAALAGWVTPTSRDWKDSAGMTAQRDGKERLDQLPRQAFSCGPLRLTVFGEMRTGSYVEMENGVQLNPAHSRWLMGLPRAWCENSPAWQDWQEWLAAIELAASKGTVTP
ncbi:hypothetical protein EQ82_08795 [Klebsiella pneumoniae]|nr:hypothetical protein EQ82_08795 [Klebsiella pneumoniae]